MTPESIYLAFRIWLMNDVNRLNLFAATPIALRQGIGIIRIAIGALMIYHGQEVFNSALMSEYATWETFKGPYSKLLVYAGKSSELVAGILLLLGLLTRVGALVTIGTLSYITFFVGEGRFWYQEQHPFMFVLFGFLFLFTGPGGWSVDALIFKESQGDVNPKK
jgi:putative oxidoreductase